VLILKRIAVGGVRGDWHAIEIKKTMEMKKSLFIQTVFLKISNKMGI